METINLFLMDMSSAQNTSGVDRYLNVLTEGLRNISYLRIHRIQLLEGGTLVFIRHETTEAEALRITLPLPKCMGEVLTQPFWMEKYNEQVFHLLHGVFEGKPRCILHLHTLNLIDLALYIKRHTPCRIITHLHCIPWKSNYNGNPRRFNQLYNAIYIEKKIPEKIGKHVELNCEWDAYHKADGVICVTRCAQEFLAQVMQKTEGVCVIPNGMADNALPLQTAERGQGVFHCLYVGVLSRSKGVHYILQALQKVRKRGFAVRLTAAGQGDPIQMEVLKKEYNDIDVTFTGLIPYDELQRYYRTCDAGVIASLQEQSSYVAIEMMMHGLPVITTAVDGLDEMFVDGESGLKVPTLFSPVLGLSADTDVMAAQIIRLIEHPDLRLQLSFNARKRYEDCFTLEKMVRETVKVYEAVLDGTEKKVEILKTKVLHVDALHSQHQSKENKNMEISVVMTAYNAEKYVAEAVESVLKQTFPNFELVFVDDGSTDSTVSIVRRFADQRIKIHERPHDYIASLNYALDMAQGKYIAHMDADDRMYPDRLRVQCAIMDTEPNIDICGAWMTPFGKEVKRNGVFSAHNGLVEKPMLALLANNYFYHPTITLRKAFIDKYHLRYEEYMWAEDYKLWTEAAKRGATFYVESQPLNFYRVSDGQICVTKKDEQRQTHLKIQREIADWVLAHCKEQDKLADYYQSMLRLAEKDYLPYHMVFSGLHALLSNNKPLLNF